MNVSEGLAAHRIPDGLARFEEAGEEEDIDFLKRGERPSGQDSPRRIILSEPGRSRR